MNSIKITRETILSMDRIRRIQIINSIPGFRSVNLVGTIGENGQTNLAIFNSVVHIGSNPPLLGMIFRPTSVERHSFENIMRTGCYTINHVQAGLLNAAHQTSAKYPRETSEFDATGLTPEFIDSFRAPFVKESTVQIGLNLTEHLELESNGTHLLVGSVELLIVPESGIREDGSLDLAATGTIAMSGLDTYYDVVELARKNYARPD